MSIIIRSTLFHTLIASMLALSKGLVAQDQTVGVFLNTSEAVNGYTLFSPVSGMKTYLIDNCGEKVKEWDFNNVPGMMAYLLEDGSVLRAGRLFNGFGAGGSGGLIEMKSWDDELLWSFRYSDQNVKQHHDLEYLDNGNILLIAWERKTQAECIAAGRDPLTVGSAGLWFEHIIELKPIGDDDAEIVWEWHLFDHMVQDMNQSIDNYGIIADHPELLDINYNGADNQGEPLNTPDIFHFNSIDYNPELDLIIVSSRNTSEIYAIDHSTTKEEAASHLGGNYDKGGDFLFRWGNDQMIFKEGSYEQDLFSQHDASWVSKNGMYTGEISIFNNGLGRDPSNTSSVEIIQPRIVDSDFVFLRPDGFVIDNQITLFPEADYDFSSARISSVQVLNNGNYFIASGNEGTVFELDPDGELLWKYINPVGQIGSVPQGQEPVVNDIFRALKYETDHPAFEMRDLIPMGALEIDPIDYGCEIYDDTDNVIENINEQFKIFPNPAYDIITVDDRRMGFGMSYTIFDTMGQLRSKGMTDERIDISELNSGIYYLKIKLGTIDQVYKFVKI